MGASMESCVELEPAVHQRQVLAADHARGDVAHQAGDALERAAHHHQARGVLVEPVHDARARQRGGVRVAEQDAVEQRARPVARGRMHHQAGGLVDHQHVLVLVDDVQRDVLGLERLVLRRPTSSTCTRQPAFIARGGAGRNFTFDLHAAVGDQALQVGARELGRDGRQQLVQPLAVLRQRDGMGADLGGVVVGLDLVGPRIGFGVCQGTAHIIPGILSILSLRPSAAQRPANDLLDRFPPLRHAPGADLPGSRPGSLRSHPGREGRRHAGGEALRRRHGRRRRRPTTTARSSRSTASKARRRAPFSPSRRSSSSPTCTGRPPTRCRRSPRSTASSSCTRPARRSTTRCTCAASSTSTTTSAS